MSKKTKTERLGTIFWQFTESQNGAERVNSEMFVYEILDFLVPLFESGKITKDEFTELKRILRHWALGRLAEDWLDWALV